MSVVALFPADNDFISLWDNIVDHHGLFVGAQGINYFLKYRGDKESAQALVLQLMKFPGCDISITT